MRICEVCGRKDIPKQNEKELFQAVKLHVCESCRENRKMPRLADWAF